MIEIGQSGRSFLKKILAGRLHIKIILPEDVRILRPVIVSIREIAISTHSSEYNITNDS
jgi:hypothetical protein